MRQTAWKARESCKYSQETLCLSLLPEVSVYFSDEFVLAHESRGVGRWWLEKDHGNAFRIGFSYQIWEASRPGVSGSSKKNSWSAGAEKKNNHKSCFVWGPRPGVCGRPNSSLKSSAEGDEAFPWSIQGAALSSWAATAVLSWKCFFSCCNEWNFCLIQRTCMQWLM